MTPERTCLAVIRACGAEPHAYLRPIGGRPLLAHAIAAAQAARSVLRVVVSTDAPEVARVARRFGAEVLERAPGSADDTPEEALRHALAALGSEVPAHVLVISGRAPLLCSADLDGALTALREADVVLCGVPSRGPIWQRSPSGSASLDVEEPLVESGVLCGVQAERFLASGRLRAGRAALHVLDATRALEVRSALDLALAEAAYRVLDAESQRARLPAPVAALVMDFDGVLTDDGVILNQDGVESVRCDRGDGLGLGFVKARGIPLLILSKEKNPVVSARAKKLSIECLQGVDDKLTRLEAWAAERDIDLDRTVYIGNDVNDLACMGRVGCAAAPRDAHPEALRAAAIVVDADGGHGAVRALCDLILG
jgi:YrbI family 3-deoxy-D-manno-octulosonate 8-phosphate phosphatase